MHGLYFEVTSDFGHFRNPFTLSFFETFLAPPRTTILGLVGAALGLDESETIKLGDKLKVGVKILEIKGFAREIVTTFNYKVKPPERTPIMREILVNPTYRVYLGSEDKDLLKSIIEALKKPKYSLYMGISEFLARVTKISKLQKFDGVMEKRFGCIVPINGEYKVRVELDVGKSYFPPKICKTVYSYEITKKGRNPKKFINLLMFLGYDVELEKPIKAYKTEENEVICLL
ncbi:MULTISPECIES: CRISPR-associated protein Cas5 [unclassified Archaeoglobus]|jgi:CRISPR-associated protein Cas5 subtype I-B|uniref:CRISPR-associated protein Cas5 n=1 Tax=unclassified Archaeoglobus TaxID=2643606 RepID=UPI0025BB8655|nr:MULTISPECIES: CRISPR-associated protein Cas5 [unclassified Archaeoglobus]